MLDLLAAEGGIALLDVNPGLIIWTLITFSVVMVVLRIFAWKPIISALDERAEKVRSDIERAESVRNEAEEKLSSYLEKLDGLKQEGQDIIAESRKDAEALKNEIVADARKEAEAIKERNAREIQLAVDKALEDLHAKLSTLSVSIASQIIGRTLKAEDHDRLISDSIKEIERLN